jgi:hypothetical protein
VTRLHNAPTGWPAFRAFRQRPVPMFHRQHGNKTHGRYSKQSIASMRMVRLCVRMLRAGLGHMPVPGVTRRIPPGWDAYRVARRGTAFTNCGNAAAAPSAAVFGEPGAITGNAR